MKIAPTIRTEIEKYLKQKGMSMTEFGHIIGLNVGTISGIITGNRSLSVNQLDRITMGMNLPPDYFYERFVEECVEESPLNWRRVKPFVYRCVELGRLDCLQRAVSMFLDNPIYSPSLFGLAEDLFRKGYRDAAAYLYENAAESERKQHSERLALCQYRLFSIRIGEDQAQNLQATAVFEAFVERLDEIDQLDALKDLANVYRSLRKWDKVDEIARKMRGKAEVQYSMKHQQKNRKNREHEKVTRGPLFGYIAYADLLCASVSEAQGDYQQALQYTYAYANLDWVKETDEDTLHWIKLFQDWADCNIYVNKLLSGDTSVLSDYIEYIAASKVDKEMVTKLLNVMFAANRFQLDVNHVLERFETLIDSFVKLGQPSSDMYTKQVIPEQLARFEYELAYYYLYRSMYNDGFKYLMYAMLKSHIINNETYFINCMGLFLHFQDYAAPETKTGFLKLIEKVWLKNVEKNVEKHGTADRRS
ncbi:helix-turn-helix domain-containing protein [Paenibacillus sp. Aloe-11]|uniref:helix-turn-helix domain-containing protein n=1 Tax=Paenibacillus sp. Aloe-11 TaxID=1050222 RepID=UPI00024EF5B1|nr:helix-turn-helix transcriptional regulator [Paenibacillus sp. Aloe-11]EHS58315.1 helix-turn-helix domain-containing protein [Paenibacillus sp. Aloe-11]